MPAQLHRLFFAVRPPPPVARAIESVAAQARAAGLAHGHWLRAAKYHITVLFLGTFERCPDAVIEQALAAGGALRFAPFEIVLDRISSFPGRRQSPCILRCAAACETMLHALQRELAGASVAAGIQSGDEQHFIPHLTLAYADHPVPQDIPIDPLRWPAREVTLMLSHVGSGRHEQVACWPLSDSTKVDL